MIDDEPYQAATMSPDFQPWRRNVEPLPVTPASIRPLIADLSFIQDKQRWGYPFRFGLFLTSQADFYFLIAQAMDVELATV
ncbi:MAG: hypothetical protein R2932_18750 [Caldilineaceae bacterium]